MTTRTFSNAVVQQKTGTASAWTAANPVLAKGQIGVESDTQKIKIGDGINTWSHLGYFNNDLTKMALPAGSVVPFAGSIDTDNHPISTRTGKANSLWFLCDGTNGTVDLRDKFIVGAGSTYAAGATGGEATHKLTVDELPSHGHTGSGSTGSAGGHYHTGTTNGAGAHSHTVGYGFSQDSLYIAQGGNSNNAYSQTTSSVGDHAHGFTTSSVGDHTHTVTVTVQNTGGGGAHNNLPPYYALCFIQLIADDTAIDVTSTGTSTAAGLVLAEIGGASQSFDGSTSKTALTLNQLRRSTVYAAGDIVFSPKLKSYQYLQCVTGGTTAATEPDLTTLSTGGVHKSDGSVQWRLRDIRCKHATGEIFMAISTPDDTEYALLCDGSSITSDAYYELYQKIGGTLPDMRGRLPQGAASGETVGTYKAAGLPNITGNINAWGNRSGQFAGASGACYVAQASSYIPVMGEQIGSTSYWNLNFDASRSNAIYGNSSTVQPPATLMNFYICYA